MVPVGQNLFHVDFSEFLPASSLAREGGVGPGNQFSSNCFSHDTRKLIGYSSDLNSDFLPLGLTYTVLVICSLPSASVLCQQLKYAASNILFFNLFKRVDFFR